LGELRVPVPDQEPCPAVGVFESMTRFFAACATQDAVGCAVAPRIRIRRLPCSITANTYIRAPDRVTVSRKSQASRASAWERRNSAHVLEHPFGRRVDPGLLQDFPHGGRGHCHPQDKQFTVDSAIPHQGFSFARRNTSPRTELTVRGRPGRFGRDSAAWRRATRPDASAPPCPDAPAAATPTASSAEAGAAAPPATPDRSG
jgi:hypothetical protein